MIRPDEYGKLLLGFQPRSSKKRDEITKDYQIPYRGVLIEGSQSKTAEGIQPKSL
jgi:hypothetical protein